MCSQPVHRPLHAPEDNITHIVTLRTLQNNLPCTHAHTALTLQVFVGERVQVVMRGCTLTGSPANVRYVEECEGVSGGLMFVLSHSSVIITDSQLVCQHSPLVKRLVLLCVSICAQTLQQGLWILPCANTIGACAHLIGCQKP
jgi:hypothetical protein